MKSQNQGSKFVVALAVGLLVVGCGQTKVEESKVVSNERAVANGSLVNFRDYNKYGAVLGLQLGASGLCTATHLAGPYILTAWHCIGLSIKQNAGMKISVKVMSPAGKEGPTAFQLDPDDYSVSYPEAEGKMVAGDGQGGEVTIPLPDLALITVTDPTQRMALAKLPYGDLARGNLEVDEPGLMMAGYGKDALEAPPVSGRLNHAPAKLGAIETISYVLDWAFGGSVGVAMPGDSGGPLFKFNQNGRISVFGVLSTGGVTGIDIIGGRKFPGKHRNHYSRIDREPVRSWLLDQTSLQ